MYTLQFDGMLRASGNEWGTQVGLLGYGWLIKKSNIEIAHGYGVFLHTCKAGSNIAEYLALIDGLDALADLRIKYETVEIRGDAKCVMDQMTGVAGVSSPLTRKLHQRARQLSRGFTNLRWLWVPRRENCSADSLSRRSFLYLHYSPNLSQEIRQQHFSLNYGGNLVPLVDLRVHTPTTEVRNYLTNR